jgi:hypothetical protein
VDDFWPEPKRSGLAQVRLGPALAASPCQWYFGNLSHSALLLTSNKPSVPSRTSSTFCIFDHLVYYVPGQVSRNGRFSVTHSPNIFARDHDKIPLQHHMQGNESTVANLLELWPALQEKYVGKRALDSIPVMVWVDMFCIPAPSHWSGQPSGGLSLAGGCTQDVASRTPTCVTDSMLLKSLTPGTIGMSSASGTMILYILAYRRLSHPSSVTLSLCITTHIQSLLLPSIIPPT